MNTIVCCRRWKAVNLAKPVQKLIALAAALALPLLLAQPAKAAVYGYTVALDGATEGNTSPGTGSASVFYNDLLHTLTVGVSFSGLTNTSTGTTVSHIHAITPSPFSGTAGVAVPFAGFPSSVRSGTYSNVIDLTLTGSWQSGFLSGYPNTAAAETALFGAMNSGQTYWNIHSGAFPGGEIRGFLVAIPEPSAIALAGCAGAGFLAWRRGRRNR